MKKCKDIQDILPLYLDDSLSADDKEIVAEHLESCQHCARELTRLSKAATLINSIHEVNPPPWFKQKIMARVREEAGKERFIQKWFYPLKIKIPVQIFATICIAVLAVYIYRGGEDRMKNVVSSSAPAPVVETQISPLPEPQGNTPADHELKMQEKRIKTKELSGEMTTEKSVNRARDLNEQMSADKKSEQFESAPAAKSSAAPATDMETKTETNVTGAASEGSMAPQTQSLSPKAATEMRKDADVTGAAMTRDSAPQAKSLLPEVNISLRVSDVDAAAGELERTLMKYGAQNITRRIHQGKITFRAGLKNQNLDDFISQLKMIGQVGSGEIAADHLKDKTIVVIDVSNR